MPHNRRTFLQNLGGLGAGLGLKSIPVTSLADTHATPAKPLAEPLVKVGLIGCRNMGWSDLTSMLKHPGVECVALCDVDSNVLNQRAAELRQRKGPTPASYADYRKLLDNKNVDAVIIGTPDHWHCLQMINACEAGKDVYVEKPIANTIEECDLMVAAKNRYNRIVQVGQWQRSDPHWTAVLDYLRKGELGNIRLARSWAYVSYGRNMPVMPDQPVPAGVDYDMWLGPAPKRAFNPSRFHGSFRYFWDYAGGLMTDWGVHMIDMVLAAMNVTSPAYVSATGGKYGYPSSAPETPDTLHASYNFGHFTMLWEQSLGTGREPYNREPSEPGVAFVGNKGTLVANRNSWEVYPEEEEGRYMVNGLPKQRNSSNGLDHHTLNFLESVRSRKQPNCTIEMGRDAALNAQLGNISYKLGTSIYWNDKSRSFENNAKANELAKAHYRQPWKLPVV